MTASYIVVPFERRGHTIGSRQMMIVPHLEMARVLAAQMAMQMPGVAIVERTFDAETGVEVDRLVTSHGAVPYDFPEPLLWQLRLH